MTITKQEVYALIDRLADKTLSFGCKVRAKLVGNAVIYDVDERGGGIIVKYINEKHEYGSASCDDETYENILETYGHPLMLGDVMEKMDKIGKSVGTYLGSTTCNDEIIHLWSRCGGLQKSLQQIVEESGWKRTRFTNVPDTDFVLKCPEARALFDYLSQLFPITK